MQDFEVLHNVRRLCFFGLELTLYSHTKLVTNLQYLWFDNIYCDWMREWGWCCHRFIISEKYDDDCVYYSIKVCYIRVTLFCSMTYIIIVKGLQTITALNKHKENVIHIICLCIGIWHLFQWQTSPISQHLSHV